VKTKILFLFIFFFSIFTLSCQSRQTVEAADWPQFRGPHASGISEGYSIPAEWNAKTSQNIKWKAAIPGLGFSSPIVWEDRIFVTTAVSGKENPELKVGLYGSIDPVDDQSVHQWKVFCLNKNTGKILWEQTAHTGVPKVKRHPKSTHANCTPAADGKYLAVFFGSEGLYCYDMDGKLIWKKDLGILDAGFFRVPEAQWEFASSPVIHEGTVIVQCDVQKNSFIAVYDLADGKEKWHEPRDEYPGWSTPAILKTAAGTQVIVNGFKHIGGYDFYSGKEIWKMSGGGDIPVPTPVIAHDLIYLNSAHGRMSPIYAVKTTAKGDITLKNDETSNEHIAWSIKRGGAYMHTPLIYGGYLHNLRGNGSLTCFDAKSGEKIYKESVGDMDSFSASGVAADGKLYFSSESGKVYVIKAGKEFKLLNTNDMDGICMATPAISKGVLYIRTEHYLYAVTGN